MILVDALVVAPAAGSLVVLACSRWTAISARAAALAVSLVTFCMAVVVALGGPTSGNAVVGSRLIKWGFWRLGADGLSMPLVLLTVFLGIIAIAASWDVSMRPGTHFALLLFLQAAVTGVFLAENVILFYVFWELVLIPMYFLIGGWGHERRRHAATKFFLYTFVGSALMLAGILVAVMSAKQWTIQALAATSADTPQGALVFWLLMAGFLVKVPAWPFHTWLPDAHVEAPTAGSIMLAGVLLKMGGYGIIRLAIPLAPVAFDEARGVILALGLVGIVMGALTSLVQTDLKRLVAYSSVSHMGFVLVAIATASASAFGAALVGMVSHGLVAGLMFFLVGALYERAHTREIRMFGGLGRVVPLWSTAFVFGALASLGLPGLSGFPGEFVTVLEGFKTYGWWMSVAVVGVVLAGAYNLRAVRGTVQGEVGVFDSLIDIGVRERAVAGVLALAILGLGMWPNAVVSMARHALIAVATAAGRVM